MKNVTITTNTSKTMKTKKHISVPTNLKISKNGRALLRQQVTKLQEHLPKLPRGHFMSLENAETHRWPLSSLSSSALITKAAALGVTDFTRYRPTTLVDRCEDKPAIQMNVRVDQNLRQKIVELARSRHTSVSSLVREGLLLLLRGHRL